MVVSQKVIILLGLIIARRNTRAYCADVIANVWCTRCRDAGEVYILSH